MNTKNPLFSKTIWINVLITIAAIFTAFLDLDWVAKYPEALPWMVGVVAVINTVLRQFTTTALSTSGGAKILAFFLLGVLAATAATHADSWSIPDKERATPVEGDTEADSGFKALAAKPGLSFKQRREMGITIGNIRKKLKALQAEGRIEGLDQKAVSALVMEELIGDNPKAFSDPNLDFDSILSFIERILPLILKIMSLFGGLVDLAPAVPALVA